MNKTLAATALATAIGLAFAGPVSVPALAQMSSGNMQKMEQQNKEKTMAMMKKFHYVACWGVAAAGKNDCASGSHSCAGQSTVNNDPASFVAMPEGICLKLAHASLKPGKA